MKVGNILFFTVDDDPFDGETDPIQSDSSDDENYEMDTGPSNKNPKLTMEYKRAALQYKNTPLKSGKLPSFNNVHNHFKFVTSLAQLNRWKKQLEAGIPLHN